MMRMRETESQFVQYPRQQAVLARPIHNHAIDAQQITI